MLNIEIVKLTKQDRALTHLLYKKVIPIAFENEGLGHYTEMIFDEIESKLQMIDDALDLNDPQIHFLIAKSKSEVIGAISYGPCGEDIKKCTNNTLGHLGELGSLVVLPQYQGGGIGSSLIKTMCLALHKQGITQFCLDSGYKLAQEKWRRKFGEPTLVVKDYWGEGFDQLIWRCQTSDYL